MELIVVYFEVFASKATVWMADSFLRILALLSFVLLGGYAFQFFLEFDDAVSQSGCILVAIALFFGYGESINQRIVGLIPRIKKHYSNMPEAAKHVNDLQVEANELEQGITKISGWQFLIAMFGTIVWGFF